MNKRIIYPKKKKIIKKNTKIVSTDKNDTNREFGTEISNVNKNKKEIKYPKFNKQKENLNNICILPKDEKDETEEELGNKKTKKYPIKKKTKPNKSKINILIKKIGKISINKNDKEKKDIGIGDYDLINNNDNDNYNDDPISEYRAEIMSNLFKGEMDNRPDYSLFPSIKDKNDNNILSFLKRFSFINFFILFQRELSLKQETLFLSINLFDRYIQKITLDKNYPQDLNLIAMTCLFISSKNEEIYPPYLINFIDIFTYRYPKKAILQKEDEILSALDFKVIISSPLLFLKIFCDNNNINEKEDKNEMNLCFHGAQFLLEICMIEPKFCELKPSLQAAICLYLARKYLLCGIRYNYRVWTFDLTFKTDYSEIQIKKNIKIAVNTIKDFYGNVYTKNFMAIPLYIKYYSSEKLRVSYKFKKIFNGE